MTRSKSMMPTQRTVDYSGTLYHSTQVTVQANPRATHRLSRREIDLILIAGCSCLITLLSHPIADALASSQVTTRSNWEPSLQSAEMEIERSAQAGFALSKNSLPSLR